MAELISTNPGRGYEVIGKVDISSEEEVISKVNKAREALADWGSLGVSGRVDILRQLIEKLKRNKEDLATLASKEMGMPVANSRSDFEDAVRYFNWYLDNAEKYLAPEISYEDKEIINTVYYEPVGVVAVIVPWNYPLSNFVWGCGQNLVAGNAIVFKHSEECPLFGKLLEEIITDCLPEGVFNEVYGAGDVGDLLIHQNIDQISFTGSSKVGKYICEIASKKFIRAVLEMGGSAPGIVFDDADLDSVFDSIFFNRFFNSGQSCDAQKRLIVHKNIADEIIERFNEKFSSLNIGDPLNESTEMGPLVAKRQLDLLEEQVAEALNKGAKVEAQAQMPGNLNGAYYPPTVLININKHMRVWSEEIFGPVLPIVTFSSDDEAITLANNTDYGLGGYIYSEDQDRAQKFAAKLNTGMVSINNASYLQPASPFGGNKNSGLGREHGKYGFREVTNIKVVAREKNG